MVAQELNRRPSQSRTIQTIKAETGQKSSATASYGQSGGTTDFEPDPFGEKD